MFRVVTSCTLMISVLATLMTGYASGSESDFTLAIPDPGPGGGVGWVERIVGGEPFGDITILGDNHFLIDVKGRANLFYDFAPVPRVWYEVKGEIRLIKSARSIRSHSSLVLTISDGAEPSRHRDSGSLRFWDRDGQWQEFTFIVYSAPEAGRGRLRILSADGSIEIRNLKIEEREDAFVAMMNSLQKNISDRYTRTGERKRIAKAVPDSLLERAVAATSRGEFNRILQLQIEAMDDREIVWAQESLYDLGLTGTQVTRLHKTLAPRREESLNSMEQRRPWHPVVDAWLEGEIAYIEPATGPIIQGMRKGHLFTSEHIGGAEAVIMDLRRCTEPDWLVMTERGRYHAAHALVSMCLDDTLTWARRVPRGLEARPWLRMVPPDDRVDVPVLVLIGPNVNGSAALAAEVLKRTGSAVLIGEATDLMPACRMRHFVPWKLKNGGRKCVLFPSGVWESSTGEILTGQRVQPDRTWPASDTDGLIRLCREILAE